MSEAVFKNGAFTISPRPDVSGRLDSNQQASLAGQCV
jgi:hypothetical protein